MPKLLKKKKNNRVRKYQEGGEVGGLLDMLAQGSPADVAEYAASEDPNLQLQRSELEDTSYYGRTLGLAPYLSPTKDQYLIQLIKDKNEENLLKALEEQVGEDVFEGSAGDTGQGGVKDPYQYLSVNDIRNILSKAGDEESVEAINRYLASPQYVDPYAKQGWTGEGDLGRFFDNLEKLNKVIRDKYDGEGLNLDRRLEDRLFYQLYPHDKEMSSIPLEALDPDERGLEESSISLPKGREAELIYKPSRETRTGQVPNYYRYFDSEGRPKRRPVEPEEYDRYMMEYRIRNPQFIKATF
jgi:hypothetical protein